MLIDRSPRQTCRIFSLPAGSPVTALTVPPDADGVAAMDGDMHPATQPLPVADAPQRIRLFLTQDDMTAAVAVYTGGECGLYGRGARVLQTFWEARMSISAWLHQLDFSYLLTLLLSAAAALLCITVHESAHGLIAAALGDPTAKRAGRISLNPFKHVDFLGLVMLAVAHVGVDGDGQGDLCADLRFDPQQGQHMGVGGHLVGALPGQRPLHGLAEVVGGALRLDVADLYMGFVEGGLVQRAHKEPAPGADDQGIILKRLHLLQGDVLDGAMGVAAHLAEILLLEGVVDGGGNGEQRGEQNGGQGNGQHRHDIPGAGRPHGAQAQQPDALAV